MSELTQAYKLLADINTRQGVPPHMIPVVLGIYMDMPRAKAVKLTRILWNWLNWGYVPVSAIPSALSPDEITQILKRVEMKRQNKLYTWRLEWNPLRGTVSIGSLKCPPSPEIA